MPQERRVLLYVAPGPIPGSELALRNELNNLHHRCQFTHVVRLPQDGGCDTDTGRVTGEWAKQKNIPIITGDRQAPTS